MATTTFQATLTGNLSTAGNWDNGLPVSGDIANISEGCSSGSIPPGVDVRVPVSGNISGGTFYSFVKFTGGGMSGAGAAVGPEFLAGCSFNGRTYMPTGSGLRYPRRSR